MKKRGPRISLEVSPALRRAIKARVKEVNEDYEGNDIRMTLTVSDIVRSILEDSLFDWSDK